MGLKSVMNQLFGRAAPGGPAVGDRIWWATKSAAGAVTRVSGPTFECVVGTTEHPARYRTSGCIADIHWDAKSAAWILGHGTQAPAATWDGWPFPPKGV